ncbi:DsbA family protein [Enterococcus sp.]|uniref:DsbA family protein n=1 Tax=Enterococcus sp. TaxID=35783 RepID=UPI0025C2519B|nr:DsbA family protein [Enterococcus sp.]
MDISIIKAEKTNTTTGIKIGADTAQPIIEFLNLRCPYCRMWFEDSLPILSEAVASGKIQRVIKLLDKEKESLQRGNVMHRFVSRSDPEQTIADITKIFQTQDQWGHLSLDEVADFAQNQLGLTDSHSTADEIVNEARQANIQFVPTVIFGDRIFDESISRDELSQLINK